MGTPVVDQDQVPEVVDDPQDPDDVTIVELGPSPPAVVVVVVAALPGVVVQSSHGSLVGRVSASQVKNSVRGQTVMVLVVVTSTITSPSSGPFANTPKECSGKSAAKYFSDLMINVKGATRKNERTKAKCFQNNITTRL